MPENKEGKKKLKIYRGHNAHVDGGNCLTVITEKCLPGLRRRIPTPYHVFRDRRLCDFEPEHQQLTVNPGRTPQWVFATHPPDQVTQAPIDFRPPCPVSGLPPPKHPKTRTVPPKNSLRLNQPGHTDQVRPELGHQYEQCAVTTAQPNTRWCSPQRDVELMT